jgi:hypothetical protein
MLCSSVFDLRIRKSDPDFGNFVFSEQAFYQFYLSPYKSNIFQPVMNCFLGAKPESCTFDIYPDKIFLWESFAKPTEYSPFPQPSSKTIGLSFPKTQPIFLYA